MRMVSLGVAIVVSVLSASLALAADIAPQSQPERLLAEINAVRERHGLGSLHANPRLAAAAKGHAADMAERDFFDHRAPDGAGLVARIVRAGYAYAHIAENLAAGHERADEVVASWMLSEGHRRNLLNAEDVDVGIGFVDVPDDGGRVRYHNYWVAIFGHRSR